MDELFEPAAPRPAVPLRMTTGFELLERWSETATQVQKNIVHQVLFAVVDRTVFRDYMVVDDVTKTMEFFVLSRCDLAVKIRVHDFETCGITYVGPTCAAPGLDQAAERRPEPRPNARVAGQEEGAPHWI